MFRMMHVAVRALLATGLIVAHLACASNRLPVPAPASIAPTPAATLPASVADPESPYRRLEGLPDGTIVHIPTGRDLTPEQLGDLLDGARVIYVGESHDNLSHHDVQLRIITALADRYPGEVAVGMEMFQRPAQPELDRWSRGELDEEAFLNTWYDNWTEDYEYYQGILRVVRDRRLPLIALNASQSTARALAAKGPEGLSPEERAALPDIDTSDPFHRRQMEAVFGAHAKGAGFDAFYRTMLLWDETMAATVADYLGGAGHGKRLVVLAGGGHVAYGFGIPRRAFRRLPVPYLVVLPHTDLDRAPADRPDAVMKMEPVTIPLPIADIVWVTGYQGLGPSAVRLGVRLETGDQGVAITSVEPESPAAVAGLREGDVVKEFDGRPVRMPGDVVRRVRAHKPGDRARLTVTRGEASVSIDVSWPP